MNLGKLLETLRGPILNDRSARVSGSSDYMWTDEELVTFINEAQNRFAALSLILRDGRTDEVTKVTLVEGQDEYPLHESVLAVLSARRMEDKHDLTRVGHHTLAGYAAPTRNWVDPAVYQHLPPGRPLAYLSDETLSDVDVDSFDQVVMRVYPTPDAVADGTELRLRVVRLPLQEFDVNDLSAECEIPRMHQIQMLDWAAYLALRIVDDDAGAANRAADFMASFQKHVTEARMMVSRKMFTPVGWGFGSNGFRWEA